MMANALYVRGRLRAEEKFDEVFKFNKERSKGQYNYLSMKLLSDGGYAIDLTQKKSGAKNVIKQVKL